MVKKINTDLDLKETMNLLNDFLKNTSEEIQINYKDKRTMKKLESEILYNFGEQVFESSRVKFVRYSK